MFHEAQEQEISGMPLIMGRQVRAGTCAASEGLERWLVLECL